MYKNGAEGVEVAQNLREKHREVFAFFSRFLVDYAKNKRAEPQACTRQTPSRRKRLTVEELSPSTSKTMRFCIDFAREIFAKTARNL